MQRTYHSVKTINHIYKTLGHNSRHLIDQSISDCTQNLLPFYSYPKIDTVLMRQIFMWLCAYLVDMRLVRLVVCEFAVLVASVLVFRSLWMLFDQYFGYDHLVVMLIVGLVVTGLGLGLLNKELKGHPKKES